MIFPAPKEKFSLSELDSMKEHIDRGGKMLFMLSEGGEIRYL